MSDRITDGFVYVDQPFRYRPRYRRGLSLFTKRELQAFSAISILAHLSIVYGVYVWLGVV